MQTPLPLEAGSPPRRSQVDLRQTLVRACVLIPLATIGISLMLFAAQWFYGHRAGFQPSWAYTYFHSNLHAAYHIFDFRGDDSWDPMIRARLWLAEHPGGNVYRSLFFERGVKFQYPLTSLLYLAWLPLDSPHPVLILNFVNLALFVLLVVSMALLATTLAERAEAAGIRFDRTNRVLLSCLAAIATICFYPVLWSAEGGQIQMLLNIWFVFAVRSHLRGDNVMAGVLLGLSSLVKPQMGLFLVWGLLRKDRRFVGGFLVPVGAGFLATAALYSWTWPLAYMEVLSFINERGESFVLNQSINGLLNRLLENGPNLDWHPGWDPQPFPPTSPIISPDAVRWPELHWQGSPFPPANAFVHTATLVSTVAFVLVGLSTGLRRTAVGGSAGALMIAGICFTMASPVVWAHHYGVLLPAFALCMVLLPDNAAPAQSRWRMWLLTGLFLLAANSMAMTNWDIQAPFNIVQSYLFFAAIGCLLLTARLAAGGAGRRMAA